MAAILVVLPIFDWITRLLPLHLSDPKWRFEVFGNFSNVTTVPLIGLFVALAFSWASGDARVRRSIGSLCLALAVVVLIVAIAFIADYLRVKAEIPPKLQHAAGLASVAAVIKELLAIAVLVLLGLGGFFDRNMPLAERSLSPRGR